MTYETLANENMILYKSLAKATNKLDSIKMVYKNFDFNNANYNELLKRFIKIYELLEDKRNDA